MITKIYKQAFAVLMKKPLLLWGISLLYMALDIVLNMLFGIVPGVGLSISALLMTAMTIIYLRGYRGEKIATVQLFACFQDWKTIKRVLCGMGWMYLWILLWALIPVVGLVFAVIRAYEYRLVPYILVMEPDVAPTEALKLSSERTKGFKGKMFLANFLPFVAIMVASFVLGLLSAIPFVGVLFSLVTVVLTIAVAALMPLFQGLVQSAFYEEIINVAHCSNCGAVLPSGAEFCPSCGTKKE